MKKNWISNTSTDEKEKQDPLAFRDAIIQGLQEIANNDLDQVSCDHPIIFMTYEICRLTEYHPV